jgi:hypothetical protein
MACRAQLPTFGLGCPIMACSKGLEACSGNWERGEAESGLGFRERHYSTPIALVNLKWPNSFMQSIETRIHPLPPDFQPGGSQT